MLQKIANNSVLLIAVALIVVGWKIVNKASQPQRASTVKSSASNAPPVNWELTKPAYDGDTITVKRNGQKVKVRFACIDAPELQQPMGRKSRDYLRSLINSSNGKVGLNVIKSDRYGRSVAEVWINSAEFGTELVQSRMISAGMAYGYDRYKSDCPSWEAVASAQEYAKSNRFGVWGGNYQLPWNYRKQKRNR